MHKLSDKDRMIRQKIGERLKFARVTLNKMKLEDASFKIFGVKKADRLLKREVNPRDAHSESFLLKACEVYGVSLAFLYGQTDNPEYDRVLADQMAMINSVKTEMNNHVKNFSLALIKSSIIAVPAKTMLFNVLTAGQNLEQQLNRTIELNQNYFDCKVRNGSALINSFNCFRSVLNEAATYKIRLENEAVFDDKPFTPAILEELNFDEIEGIFK
jgi:hypothetical protein